MDYENEQIPCSMEDMRIYVEELFSVMAGVLEGRNVAMRAEISRYLESVRIDESRAAQWMLHHTAKNLAPLSLRVIPGGKECEPDIE